MIELNKVYNQDCLEGMQGIADKSVDLTVTSPPYDNLRTYNGSLEWSFEIFQSIAKELFRVTKDGGVVVWVVGDATINGSETGTSFKQALWFMECGFRLHDTMIYKTEKMPMNHNRYEQKFEYMFVFSKGKPKAFTPFKEPCKYYGETKKANYGILTDAKKESGDAQRYRDEKWEVKQHKIKGNVWEYNTGYNHSTKDKIAFQHPAIFPEQLAHDHILSWSNEGDVILEPFAGSGTTIKQAILLNRNYIGFEKEEKYYNIILERIKKHTQQLKCIA